MTLPKADISLLIGAVGVASLLSLILKLRMQPFLALLLVSVGVGVAAGTPIGKLPALIETGVGDTLGHVALIVALGAMIGRIVEASGGADQLAHALVKRFGDARAAIGLAIAGFLVGIPVFFEVGVVMLLPLAQGVARETRKPLPSLALPLCIVLLTIHAMLPPHPGAVAAAALLHVDLGRLVIWGLPVVIVTSAFGVALASLLSRGVEPALSPGLDGDRSKDREGGPPDTDQPPPGAALIASLIVLPILLILSASLSQALLAASNPLRQTLELAGTPFVALLLDVLLCCWALGVRRGWSLQAVSDVVASGVPPVAIVILITGAGGAFAKVLVASGVGGAVSDALRATGLPVLALGFLLAMLLRVAQGPTAVAIIAAAGIISPLVAHSGLSPNQLALVCVALGAGGMSGSHVNDAGFWIVTRLIGLNVAQGLRTWTVLSAATGLFAFALTALLWRFA